MNLTEEQFLEILKKKMYYLEGLADSLHDEPRKALRRWIDDVRRMIKKREDLDLIDLDKVEPTKDSLHPQGF